MMNIIMYKMIRKCEMIVKKMMIMKKTIEDKDNLMRMIIMVMKPKMVRKMLMKIMMRL